MPAPTFDVDHVFCYHAPTGTQPQRYVEIREQAKQLARTIQALTPASREQSIALTHLQTVVMFANAAIAINENPIEAAEPVAPPVSKG